MLISVFVGLNAYGGMSGHVSHQNITMISINLKLIIFLMCPPKVRVIWGGKQMMLVHVKLVSFNRIRLVDKCQGYCNEY